MQIKKITLTLLLLLNFIMLLGCNINGNTSSTNKRNTEYKINYHLFGGENRKNIESYNESMKPFTLLDPVRTSCTFDGWYLDPEYINPVAVIDSSLAGDLEIYAKWIEGITENSFSFDLGLKKEYVLYHISDLHVISDTDSTGIEKERNRVGTNGVGGTRESYAKEFNEAYDLSILSTSSIDNYYKIMSYINSKNPDGICITGDLIDYSSTKNYAFLNDELSKISVPFIWTIGNHENPPSSFDGLPGIDTPDFTVLDFEDFKIISLNNTNQDDDHRFCYNERNRKIYRQKLGIKENEMVIGHVGMFNYQKNHELLIDIFYRIVNMEKNKDVNYKLLLIGDGEQKDAIENKVKNLNLYDSTIFSGIKKYLEELSNNQFGNYYIEIISSYK